MVTPQDFWGLPEPDAVDVYREGGRPMLVPAAFEGQDDPVRVSYSRASSLADQIEAKGHIHRWEMRYLAKAMGQNEDLAALAAVEPYSTGISDAVFGREKSASGRRLDDLIERALDRVRIHEKADRGTAVHGATEPDAPPLDRLPERLRPPVKAFDRFNAEKGIRIVGTELFTVNDTTMSAGTFDHAIYVPGHPLLGDGLIVADKKTGRYDPFSWAVQISSYARGLCYNTTTDRRVPWPDKVNLDWGFVWQIDAETAQVTPHLVDLQFGWEMAQIAARVRDAHDRTDIAARATFASFEERLSMCQDVDSLRHLWEADPDPAHKAAIEQKVRALS